MFRRTVSLTLAGVVLLAAITGCAGMPGAEALTEGAASQLPAFTLQLPRIYLNYVETADGSAEPSVAGIGASLVEAWFGLDLSAVRIPAFYVDWLQASDIQHVELLFGPQGLLAYANGKPTPYVAWDTESLTLAADVAGAFGVPNVSTVKNFLPWMERVTIDILVQLPVADGAERIAYRDVRGGLLTTKAAPEIVEPAGQIKLEMSYDEEGYPSLLGLPAETLRPFLGTTPGRLAPQVVGQLQEAGVESLTLKTRGDGLFIFVNDQPLPNVAWSREHLSNALDIYADMNETGWTPNAAFVSMVRQIVLQTANSDIELVVNFPS